MSEQFGSHITGRETADLERRLTRVEDVQQIANVQGRYNHYVLCGDHEAILELFSTEQRDEIITELGDAGRGVGWQAATFAFHDILINDLYNFPGNLGLHNLTTPVIEIAPDGRLAKGMWLSLGFNTHRLDDGTKVPVIQPGKYFQTFVKESDGIWRYLKFQWQVIFRTPLGEGWVQTPIAPGPTMRNDVQPVTEAYHPYSPDELWHFPPLPPTPETFDTCF